MATILTFSDQKSVIKFVKIEIFTEKYVMYTEVCFSKKYLQIG